MLGQRGRSALLIGLVGDLADRRTFTCVTSARNRQSAEATLQCSGDDYLHPVAPIFRIATVRALIGLIATLGNPAPAFAVENEPATIEMLGTAPLHWLGVEVIASDFDLVERVRQATGLKPGTVLPITDHKLKEACDAVRRELPSTSVQCSPTLGEKIDGLTGALYVVEINNMQRPPLAPPQCNSAATLARDLALLANEWKGTLVRTMIDGDLNTERVNGNKYLDYDSSERHELVERIHATVKSKVADLEVASSSCRHEQRSDALYLMNFTGEPERAISSATHRMVDPDSQVRNAATRLLMTFAAFIPESQVFSIAREACLNTDRNKSLLLLNELRKRGALKFFDLNETCQIQIRHIARTSVANQILQPARQLVESAGTR